MHLSQHTFLPFNVFGLLRHKRVIEGFALARRLPPVFNAQLLNNFVKTESHTDDTDTTDSGTLVRVDFVAIEETSLKLTHFVQSISFVTYPTQANQYPPDAATSCTKLLIGIFRLEFFSLMYSEIREH